MTFEHKTGETITVGSDSSTIVSSSELKLLAERFPAVEVTGTKEELVVEHEGNRIVMRGVKDIREISAISFVEDFSMATDVVRVDDATVKSATVQLAKHGSVEAIARCDEYDVVAQECFGTWVTTNIPFTDHGSYIEFTVDHFSSYGGVPGATRYYVTSSSGTQTPSLATSQDDSINEYNQVMEDATFYNLINASVTTTGMTILNGATINFSGYFVNNNAVENSAYATFVLYYGTTAPTTKICQAGDNSTGGSLLIDNTAHLITTSCPVTSQHTVPNGDKLWYQVNVYSDNPKNGADTSLQWDTATADTWVEVESLLPVLITVSTDSAEYGNDDVVNASGTFTENDGTPLQSNTVTVQFRNTTNDIVREINVTTDASGDYWANYTISSSPVLGVWNVTVQGWYNTTVWANESETFNVTTFPPTITGAEINESSQVLNNTIVKVNATITDSDGDLDSVWLTVTPPVSAGFNATLQVNGDEYYNDTLNLSEGGDWVFTFYANDSLGDESSTVAQDQLGNPYISVDNGQVDCGEIITQNTNLTENLTCSGTAFTIGAPDIIIDGKGFTVTGNTTGYGFDNTGGYDNVTINDFIITNFSDGVVASNGAVNNTIYNNSFNTTYSGIFASDTTRLNITGNTIFTHTGSYTYGVWLDGSDDAVIDRNDITTTSTNGAAVMVVLNTAINNRPVIRSNTINTTGSLSGGITIGIGHNATIYNNTLTTANDAISVSDGSENVNISGNTITTITNAGAHGINLVTAVNPHVEGNTINTATTNSFGIYLSGSDVTQANIKSNTITTTGLANAIYVDAAPDATIWNNTLNTAYSAIYIVNEPTDTNITLNDITTHTVTSAHGINLLMGIDTVIERNTINTTTTGSRGIHTGGPAVQRPIIKSNIITTLISNGGEGIWIAGVPNSTIWNNTFDTGDDCIYVALAASNTNITENRFTINSVTLRNSIFILNATDTTIDRNMFNYSWLGQNSIHLSGTDVIRTKIRSNTITSDLNGGFGITLSNCLNTTVWNNTIALTGANADALRLEGAVLAGINISENSLSAGSFSEVLDVSIVGVNGTILENQMIGSYNFDGNNKIIVIEDGKGRIDFTDGFDATSGTNFSEEIAIGTLWAYVNGSKAALNKSANITLYNNPYRPAKIMRDGVDCGSECTNLTSLNISTVKFNVTGWSNYSLENNGDEVMNVATCNAINSCFIIQNATDTVVQVDNQGNIDMVGLKSESQGSLTIPDDSLVIEIASGPVAYFDKNGNLVTKGTIATSDATAPSGDDDFIIMNSTGGIVAHIDGATGNCYFKGSLAEDVII